MDYGGPKSQTHHLIESFAGAQSVLQEVFNYYKVERYGQTAPEKPYFLLSRCMHILFSLWLAQQEGDKDFFSRTSPPAAFSLGLDFGQLRYSEYKRRMLHANAFDEHLTNETNWFEFWTQILAQLHLAGAPAYQQFCNVGLAYVRQSGFLEGKMSDKNRKALALYLQGDETGRAMVRTMLVLEDFAQAIIRCFTTPEARTCVLEQVILLTGLLSEMRRIVVWETPAKGPYTPFRDHHWRTPSLWNWLSRDQTQGFLTVVPKRHGGEVSCTFQPVSDAQGDGVSWVRRIASLKGSYERELLATWAYDTGKHREDPQRFPDVTACWTVQNAEAQHLEGLAKQVDLLLAALQNNPRCQGLVEAVRGISRREGLRWKAMVLPWTHIRQLDRLLGKLTFVQREARTLGGHDAAPIVIERIWLSGEAVGGEGWSVWQGKQVSRNNLTGVNTPEQHGTRGAGASTPHQIAPCTKDRSLRTCVAPGLASAAEQARDAEAERAATVPAPLPVEQEISEAQSASATLAATSAPAPRVLAEVFAAAQPTEMDAEGTAARASLQESVPELREGTRTRNTICLEATVNVLLRRLLDHHGCVQGMIHCKPLTTDELERDLGCHPSDLQRALADIFGPQPIRSYRHKCQDGTIFAFLQAFASDTRRPTRYDTLT